MFNGVQKLADVNVVSELPGLVQRLFDTESTDFWIG